MKRKSMIIGFCLLTVFVSSTHAEIPFNKPNKKYFWVTLGVGRNPDLYPKYSTISAAIIPTLQFNNNIFSLRCLGLIEFIMEGPDPEQYIKEISLLYGRCFKREIYNLSASVGIGYLDGLERGERLGTPGVESYKYESFPFNTFGLSIDTNTFIITPILGFGINLNANINNKRSYWGILLCMQLGHIQ